MRGDEEYVSKLRELRVVEEGRERGSDRGSG